jgi:phosphoglycolate phosphatase-like HAD superfamily hydrolase
MQGIVFDGDDTLWWTEPLYDEARQAARAIVEQGGLDGAAWDALQRQLDVENVARLGYTRNRFPTSCARLWIDAHAWEYERGSEPVDERVIEVENPIALLDVAR